MRHLMSGIVNPGSGKKEQQKKSFREVGSKYISLTNEKKSCKK